MASENRLAEQAQRFRALHVPGRPVVLPNAWDAASARSVAAAGFPAVATASSAIATTLGYEDGEQIPAEQMFAAVARISRAVDLPVSADIESGYGLDPAAIVDLLLEAGAVGCNLEDTDHTVGGLVPVDEQAARIRRLREAADSAGVAIVINARVDVYLREIGAPDSRLDEAIRRGSQYRLVKFPGEDETALRPPGSCPGAGRRGRGLARWRSRGR